MYYVKQYSRSWVGTTWMSRCPWKQTGNEYCSSKSQLELELVRLYEVCDAQGFQWIGLPYQVSAPLDCHDRCSTMTERMSTDWLLWGCNTWCSSWKRRYLLCPTSVIRNAVWFCKWQDSSLMIHILFACAPVTCWWVPPTGLWRGPNIFQKVKMSGHCVRAWWQPLDWRGMPWLPRTIPAKHAKQHLPPLQHHLRSQRGTQRPNDPKIWKATMGKEMELLKRLKLAMLKASWLVFAKSMVHISLVISMFARMVCFSIFLCPMVITYVCASISQSFNSRTPNNYSGPCFVSWMLCCKNEGPVWLCEWGNTLIWGKVQKGYWEGREHRHMF